MLKAVIFDMDGVLIDSEPLHCKAHILAMQKRGIVIDETYCNQFIGSTTNHMLQTLKKEFNLTDSVEQLLEEYIIEKEHLIELEGHIPIPYTKELIIDLYHHGIKMAIASSSSVEEIEDVVTSLDIKKYMNKLVSGTTVPNPKPSPDVFLKAMKELEVNRDECIIIEDSCNGTKAGVAAGIPVIGFINPNSGNQDLSKASLLIEGFDEIDFKFIDTTYRQVNNLPITITTTNRLDIKELSTEDIPALYNIYQNIDTKMFINYIAPNIGEAIACHKSYIENVYHFYGYGLWGIFKKDTNQLIGQCGIQNTRINQKDELELSYVLDKKEWGNGYGIESVKAVIQYGFHNLNIKRIVAQIHIQNQSSIQLVEKIGFKKESLFIKNQEEYVLYVIEEI